jgi:hypothetical protein
MRCYGIMSPQRMDGQVLIFKLDFGHLSWNQIAGKWQPGKGLSAGAWEAEEFREVYLPTRRHFISGQHIPALAWSAKGRFLNGQSRVKDLRRSDTVDLNPH